MNKGLLTALSLMVGASCANADGPMDSFILDDFPAALRHSPVRPVTEEDVTAAQVAAAQDETTTRPRSRSSEDVTAEMRRSTQSRSTWYGNAYHKAMSFFRYVFSMITG